MIIKLKEKGVGGRKEIEGDKERERDAAPSNLLASLGVKAWFIRLCDESCPNGFHVVVSLPLPTDFAQRHVPLKDLVLRVTEGCVLGVEGAIVRLPSSLLPLAIYTVSCLASVLIAWLAARHAPQWRAHCQDPCRALRQAHSPLGLAAFRPAQQANTGLPAVCGQKSHRSGETEGQEPLQLERPGVRVRVRGWSVPGPPGIFFIFSQNRTYASVFPVLQWQHGLIGRCCARYVRKCKEEIKTFSKQFLGNPLAPFHAPFCGEHFCPYNHRNRSIRCGAISNVNIVIVNIRSKLARFLWMLPMTDS